MHYCWNLKIKLEGGMHEACVLHCPWHAW